MQKKTETRSDTDGHWRRDNPRAVPGKWPRLLVWIPAAFTWRSCSPSLRATLRGLGSINQLDLSNVEPDMIYRPNAE